MGCASSKKTTVVKTLSPSSEKGNEAGSRGDSATSKTTTDSGVSLDTEETPGQTRSFAWSEPLPPLQGPGLDRPMASEILEQLLTQGIISSHPKQEGSGEAYNIWLKEEEMPRRRPPARLESLKIRTMEEATIKEDLEMKMRQVEERRKKRQEDIKRKLRIKSARVRVAVMGEQEVASSHQVDTAVNGESEDQRVTDSPELENDVTFQKPVDTEESF